MLSIYRFLNCIFLCPISTPLSVSGTIEPLVKLNLSNPPMAIDKVSISVLEIEPIFPKFISFPLTFRSPEIVDISASNTIVPTTSFVIISLFSNRSVSVLISFAPLRKPLVTVIKPSNTIGAPSAGSILIAPLVVFILTVLSPGLILSAETLPAITLVRAEPSITGRFPTVSN